MRHMLRGDVENLAVERLREKRGGRQDNSSLMAVMSNVVEHIIESTTDRQ